MNGVTSHAVSVLDLADLALSSVLIEYIKSLQVPPTVHLPHLIVFAALRFHYDSFRTSWRIFCSINSVHYRWWRDCIASLFLCFSVDFFFGRECPQYPQYLSPSSSLAVLECLCCCLDDNGTSSMLLGGCSGLKRFPVLLSLGLGLDQPVTPPLCTSRQLKKWFKHTYILKYKYIETEKLKMKSGLLYRNVFRTRLPDPKPLSLSPYETGGQNKHTIYKHTSY